MLRYYQIAFDTGHASIIEGALAAPFLFGEMVMGKIKSATAAKSVDSGQLAVIVFGRDENQRPHASTFSAEEAELAEKAAGLMGMLVLRVTTDEHRQVASELPAGRIFASGKGFVPFCADGTYKRLEGFGEAFQPEPPTEPAAPTHSSVPSDWASVEVGSLVLACEAPGTGHFECVVIAAPGDDLFQLRWVHWPDMTPFVRRREHLGLLTEDLAALIDQLSAPPAEVPEAVGAEA